MGLLTPNPQVSYGFLVAVFAVWSAISAALFLTQYYKLTDSVTGFWIVPAPALPALFWAMLLRSKAAKLAAAQPQQGQAAGDKKSN